MILQRQFLNIKCLLIVSVASIAFLSKSNAADGVEADNQKAVQSRMQEVSWTLRLPQSEKVIYKGLLNTNKEYKSIGLLIPIGDPILAGILVASQVVANNKLHDKKLNASQEAADKILLPFQPFLQSYSYSDLMGSALSKVSFNGNKKLINYSDVERMGKIIESVPIYVMTQDRSAIILNNVITIYDLRVSNAPIYKNVIVVVSQTRDGSKNELADFWGAKDGAKLKEESARLLASSFNLAIAISEKEAGDKSERPQKTFHYIQGNFEKMERGELVGEGCNRIIIKNLRGWLMSLPVTRMEMEAETLNSNQCIDILSSAL